MCLLSIITFLSPPTPLDSITWQVSSGTYLVLQIEQLSKKLINRGLIQVGYY